MTQALQTLIQHAERQRDAALAAMQQADEAVQRLVQQAAQLAAYRAESLLRHPARDGRSASIELLRCHQGFIQRLDQAIAQQQVQQQTALARATQQRIALLALETRVASVRKMIERRGIEARQRETQREQRRSDDAFRPRGDAAMARSWQQGSQAMPL